MTPDPAEVHVKSIQGNGRWCVIWLYVQIVSILAANTVFWSGLDGSSLCSVCAIKTVAKKDSFNLIFLFLGIIRQSYLNLLP